MFINSTVMLENRRTIDDLRKMPLDEARSWVVFKGHLVDQLHPQERKVPPSSDSGVLRFAYEDENGVVYVVAVEDRLAVWRKATDEEVAFIKAMAFPDIWPKR